MSAESASEGPAPRPRRTRVGSYAVVVRDGQMLLSRLAPFLSPTEQWTLPGGGVEFAEHPRDAVIREVREETGLAVTVGETVRVYDISRNSERDGVELDYHSIRLVYEGWVPPDAPEPHVVEVDGSTVDAAWHPVADVLSGRLPTVGLVREALADHETFQLQRPAAYALIRRGDDVLLTRISALGFNTGSWTLPGGGIDHGEAPADAVKREVREECGVTATVGRLVGVHDAHFSGTSPSGRFEDFHGIHLIFEATVPDGAEPRVVEQAGTTDAVAWVSVHDIETGAVDVLDLVRAALDEEKGGASTSR